MSHSKLDLDQGLVESCRQAAARIAADVGEQLAGMTSVAVERTVARLFGIDGANELGAPLPNVVVDHVRAGGGLGKGVAHWIANAMIHVEGTDPPPAQTGAPSEPSGTAGAQRIAQAVEEGTLDLCALALAPEGAIRERARAELEHAVTAIDARMETRRALREHLGESPPPLRYVLTATGNVYEDVVHGLAVAEAGGDIVAVIRSTAQSLLDYVPYGPTTEGYGGTFATQANFRIMREAMDEWS
ncbi:MAG TPA: lysine 5,6-aminomutase subunit alpha, partial [Solirubrobacteraceae bacterium]|nr:lysine 5,6-aminomutase subunit alpha [Solirubrobacteraceae bacterium]